MATVEIRCPDRSIQPGGPADECAEDGRYGVPDLSYRSPALRISLHAEDDVRWTILPLPPENVHLVTIICGRTCGRISGLL